MIKLLNTLQLMNIEYSLYCNYNNYIKYYSNNRELGFGDKAVEHFTAALLAEPNNPQVITVFFV